MNLPAMRLQPGQAEVFQLPLADGEDAPQILAYLHALSMQFAQAPYVREFAVNRILRAARIGDNDQGRQVEAVLNFVRRALTYVRDPVESEYVISPVNLLQQIDAGQQAFGDCEDHCLLLNSLLGAIGFPTRFVATLLREDATEGRPAHWNHVISSVFVGGRWVDLDPVAKGIMQPDYYEQLIGETNFGG
jgi:transglutaminase-like putative cysteine protease